MTSKLRATLALSLAIANCPSGGAHAATVPGRTEDRAEAMCEAASPNAAKLGCYVGAAATARSEVERAFERSLRRAMAFDRDANSFARLHRTRSSILARQLRASQSAWSAYSRYECLFEGGSSFGGSGTDILEAACRCRLYKRRLAELDAAARLLDR